jgi:hypothetical protein
MKKQSNITSSLPKADNFSTTKSKDSEMVEMPKNSEVPF